MVTRETVELRASLAHLGALELRVNLASLVPLDFLERRVQQDNLVLKDLQV